MTATHDHGISRKLSQNDRKELCGAVDLGDLIGRSVTLTRRGQEFESLCPLHEEDTPSFTVVPKKGFFHCFGCGAHGDALGWLTDGLRMTFQQAVEYLRDETGKTLPDAPKASRGEAAAPSWVPVEPIPDDVPPLLLANGKTAAVFNPKGDQSKSYRPAHVATYRNAAGEVLGYVLRCELKGGAKFTPQVTWCLPQGGGEGRWCLVAMKRPRSLYGLEKLAGAPDAPVIVVMGEKKADSLQDTLGPDVVAMTWAGGDNGRSSTDFSTLAGRKVSVWADADQGGRDAALGEKDRNGAVVKPGACALLKAIGADSVRAIIPPDSAPKGWDAGDLIKEGKTAKEVWQFIAEHLQDPDAPRSIEHPPEPPAAPPPAPRPERSRPRLVSNAEPAAGQPPPPPPPPPPAGPNDDRSAAINSVVRELNAEYAVVNEGGKALVFRVRRDDQLERDVIERISFEDFKKFYLNRRIVIGTGRNGDIYENIGTVWLEHWNRRQFLKGVVMCPTGKVPAGCWNLWRGFSIKPSPGDWSKMRDHIEATICGGNESLSTYVLNWLSRMVQHPDKQGEVALVLRGKKGTGKGTLGNWLLKILGQHGIQVSHSAQLVGKFNSHLRDAVFVFADEAFFAGDRINEGALKSLITEPIMAIEGKGKDIVSAPNMTHVLMASNSDWVVPASIDERRYCVVDVSQDRIGDKAYFADLADQARNGGLAAMLHDLLKRNISGFDHRDVPDTAALADQKKLSLDSQYRWWLAVLERGFVFKSKFGTEIFKAWSQFVTTQLMVRSYQQWCKECGVKYPKSQEDIGRMMRSLYRPSRPSKPYPVYEVEANDQKLSSPAVCMRNQNGYLVGLLDNARAAFVEKTGIQETWGDDLPDQDEADNPEPDDFIL